jgi:hypothetical protein
MKPAELVEEYPSAVMTPAQRAMADSSWPPGAFEVLFLDNYGRLAAPNSASARANRGAAVFLNSHLLGDL